MYFFRSLIYLKAAKAAIHRCHRIYSAGIKLVYCNSFYSGNIVYFISSFPYTDYADLYHRGVVHGSNGTEADLHRLEL